MKSDNTTGLKQNPMFIRQSLRKVVLLYFEHCMYPVLEKSQNSEVLFFCMYTNCPSSLSCTTAEEKESSHIQIQKYCSYMHNRLYLIHSYKKSSCPETNRSSIFFFFFCKCLVNHFIIPSVSSTVYPKHFLGLATGVEGL